MVETILVLLVMAVVLVIAGVKVVPQGQNWTVERFGRYTYTLDAGLHLIVPLVDTIGHKLNMMEQVLDVEPQQVISKDNAMVTVDAVCFFVVVEAKDAAYEVSNLPLAMRNLVMTNIRAVVGSMDLDELLSKRDEINTHIQSKVTPAAEPWGVRIARVEIKDIAPPPDIVNAMAAQLKAEREKRAVMLEAEGRANAVRTQAEGDKSAMIARAQGQLEAAKLEAEARERLAQAEAVATQVVSEAIAHNGRDAIQYFVATKYIEALQGIGASSNSKLVMIPLEASSVIGAVSGIQELLHKVSSEMRTGETPPAT